MISFCFRFRLSGFTGVVGVASSSALGVGVGVEGREPLDGSGGVGGSD